MNYREPLQRKDGRWDYTCNRHPTGYCCEYRPIDTKLIPISESQLKAIEATAHKHHADGHATKEEAIACYKEYTLDHKLRLGRTLLNQQMKCRVCQKYTEKFAEVGSEMIVLCEEHNNREEVEKLYEAPEWSMASW